MDSTIRKTALRSAAKVAFGASICWGAALSGCGGKSVYGPDEGSDEGTDVQEIACTLPVEPTGTRSWDVEAYSCCASYLEQKVPQGSRVDVGALAMDPSAVGCCRYVTASYGSFRDEAGAMLPFPYSAHEACCNPTVLTASEADNGFCAPWGPPVPPALPDELEVA